MLSIKHQSLYVYGRFNRKNIFFLEDRSTVIVYNSTIIEGKFSKILFLVLKSVEEERKIVVVRDDKLDRRYYNSIIVVL